MKRWLLVGALSIALLAGWALWQVRMLEVAHSTFNNYYAFRGCTNLVERTDTYGVCTTGSGATIKIVLYQGRWFLDGDLPCASGLCW